MKYMKQFAVILAVTCIGEVLKYFIPLPIPGSIYGLVFMLLGLMSGLIKVENVKETGEFLIEIMPLMFIPAGVGLIASWEQLSGMLIPVIVISVVSTYIVIFATGKVSAWLLSRKKEGGRDESDHS